MVLVHISTTFKLLELDLHLIGTLAHFEDYCSNILPQSHTVTSLYRFMCRESISSNSRIKYRDQSHM